MAVSVDVLKLTQVEGVVCVRGTVATGTIALGTTLKKSTETQSSPTANIKGLQWTLSSGKCQSAKKQCSPLGTYGKWNTGLQWIQ